MTATADYGEQGPEDFDRFGIRHHVEVRARRARRRTFVEVNLNAAIQRLGLTLRHWERRWQGVHHYHLKVHNRLLEIRRYSDGRISLFLDDQPVYVEKTKVVTVHGKKYRTVELWHDPAAETIEDIEDARQARLEDVRARLGNWQSSQ